MLGAWLGAGDRLPGIPAGDIFHLAPALDGVLCSIRLRIETCERFLRRWEVSGALLVSFATLLALLLFFARP